MSGASVGVDDALPPNVAVMNALNIAKVWKVDPDSGCWASGASGGELLPAVRVTSVIARALSERFAAPGQHLAKANQ